MRFITNKNMKLILVYKYLIYVYRQWYAKSTINIKNKNILKIIQKLQYLFLIYIYQFKPIKYYIKKSINKQ